MPLIDTAQLRAVRSRTDVVMLFQLLGYRAASRTANARDFGLADVADTVTLIRSSQRRREGYAVVLLEAPVIPRALVALGRRLLEQVHDHPLGIVGITDPHGRWTQLLLLRPRLITSPDGRPAYRVAKFLVDLRQPTHHAREVLDRLRWQPTASDAQEKVDEAFDVEAVTRQFFVGLDDHYLALLAAVAADAAARPAAMRGITQAGGPDRVAMRILSQILFTWFLQQKGLLAGDRQFLLTRWRQRDGAYYATELEPLFYATFAVPEGRRPPEHPGTGLPFLNGGLFARQYGPVSLALPDAVFDLQEGLLGFLNRWTFTISEEAPDEVDVAIDPELLGRIFENLITDDEQARHGVVYTPRPVVQFMCREALIGWLETTVEIPHPWSRQLLVDPDPLRAYHAEHGSAATLALTERVHHALDVLTVLDPAVGSGAFLLGMMAELVRLRHLLHVAQVGQRADVSEVHAWKLQAIQHTLFGVDIEPLALELCRLRLWLSLIADLPDQGPVPPLPNLEYRTVAGDSLTDFVGGLAVQDTRRGIGVTHQLEQLADITPTRDAFFATTDPMEKAQLRETLEAEENAVVQDVLDEAARHISGRAPGDGGDHLAALSARFASPDRVFPIFMPAFHAPDVVARGGWDIVIMNPPYLGKKQVAQKVPAGRRADYAAHHEELNDLMILFCQRALQLVRPNGVCSVIIQDSIFTSTDGTRLRQDLVDRQTLRVIARTKCFEGRAINGAVLVWHSAQPVVDHQVRWVEGFQRDPRDFAAASAPLIPSQAAAQAGSMEVFQVPLSTYRHLPPRILFRPAPEALTVLAAFDRLPQEFRREAGWNLMSKTRALTNHVAVLHRSGWFASLQPGSWVPLGYCVIGGQGLATADDMRFLAAIEGSAEAEQALAAQARLVSQLETHPTASSRWRQVRAEMPQEDALLAMWGDPRWEEDRSLKWPRLLRIAPRPLVRTDHTPLNADERAHGISRGPFFIPFEKADQSSVTDDGNRIGATWWRNNSLVIDWSSAAVHLLRQRATSSVSHHKPYFRNEELQGLGGITWNRVASYLRVRIVPPGSFFGDMAPTIAPTVSWLSPAVLMALLNADTVDYLVRTFLGSRMHVELGDIRRIPIPVLSPEQQSRLETLGNEAICAARAANRATIKRIECTINGEVRRLYDLSEEATLWVIR